MTKYSKILTVFLLLVSLSFMAFAAVNLAGGPNWEAEAKQLEEEYVFEYSGGENPTWSVKPRLSEDPDQEPATIKSSPILAEVVIAARRHKTEKQREEIERLDKQIPQVDRQVQQAQELIEIDLAAMKGREEQLAGLLDELQQRAEAVAADGVRKARQAEEIRAEVARRRADVFRLLDQLKEVQTDRFQIIEQRKRLRDLLARMNGVLSRLKRRQDHLKKAGATVDYEK